MRVCAVRNADDDAVYLYGEGEMVGDEPCPLLAGHPNPKIVLDDLRGHVWGCECWWFPAEEWEAFAGTRAAVLVDPPDRENERPTAFVNFKSPAVFPFTIRLFDSGCPHKEVWTQTVDAEGALDVPSAKAINEGREVMVHVVFGDGTDVTAPEGWTCPVCEWRLG